jgi:hypothetical protein
VNKKSAPVLTGIKENLALGSLPLTAITNDKQNNNNNNNNAKTGMQRRYKKWK